MADTNSFSQLWNDASNGNWSAMGGDLANVGMKNAGAIAGAGLMGYQALTTPSDISKAYPEAGALSQQAQQLMSQGGQLQSYLTSGGLPAGQQAALDQATQANIARVRSQYASMGLSGSTMEQQAINAIQLQAQSQAFQMAQQLYNTGLQESGLASQDYARLLQLQMQSDQGMSSAIANFAGALAGGGGLVRAG